MLLPRPPLLSALLLLLLAACRCTAAALLRGATSRTEALADRVDLTGRYPRTRTETLSGLSGARGRGERSNQGPVTNHRDPQHKEKFIIHLTGPLSFDPKCKKQFHRLYHNTRDCTVPAYYRRCARLLIQLAKSPRCAAR